MLQHSYTARAFAYVSAYLYMHVCNMREREREKKPTHTNDHDITLANATAIAGSRFHHAAERKPKCQHGQIPVHTSAVEAPYRTTT